MIQTKHPQKNNANRKTKNKRNTSNETKKAMNIMKTKNQANVMKTACLALFGLIASLQLISAQTITTVLYQEDWGSTNGGSSVSAPSDVGWTQVLGTGFSSGFTYNSTAPVDDKTGATLPANSMWYGNNNSGFMAMFYTTNGAGSGTYGDSAFTTIDPTLYTNLELSVYEQTLWQGAGLQTWFAVEVGGAWYVATNNPVACNLTGGSSYTRTDMTYNPAATSWNALTIDTINTNVVIGGPAGANLSGPITGIGIVSQSGNNTWRYMNELLVSSISNAPAAVPPTLVAAPLSQNNVYAGGGVSFTVGVSPSQSYDYYWQKGGVTLTNDSRISGVNSATLTILNATAADDGNYSVIVSNSAGFFDTSTNSAGPAYLNVNPVPADYLYAETFQFVGPFTGIAYPLGTVGWSNSVPNNPNRLFYNNGNASGSISAAEDYSITYPSTIFFYATTNSDTGTSGLAFPAIAPTAYPAIAFSVNVNPTPNFYSGQGNSTAYFAVQMNGGSWYVSSAPILVDTTATSYFSTYQQQFSPAAATWNNLTFNSTGATVGGPAAADLTGKITGAGMVVVLTYASEWDFANFLITTDAVPAIAPVIDGMPRNQTVYNGGGVSFQVHLKPGTGSAPLYFFWQKGGVILTNSSRISGAGSKTLTITDANTNDEGNYSCIVSNSAGWDNSGNYSTATLTVNPVPPSLLYAETFPTPEVPDGFYSTTTIGWNSAGSMGLYAGSSGTSPAYFYSGGAGKAEFYATIASDTGVSGLAFPRLNLAANTNLVLSATLGVYNTNTTANLIVQITSGGATNWFISATGLPLLFTTMNYLQAFAPGATNWNNFDVNTMTVGSQAASDLAGSLTGAGVFINYPNGENGSFNYFDIHLPEAPQPPVGLSATAGDTQVALSWTASFGATSYNVKRSTISGAETTITNVTAANYTDTQVTNGILYYYEVSAINTYGESTNSVEVSAIPQAPQLGSISVGSFAGNTLTLNWTAGANVSLQSATNLTPPVVWTDVPGTAGQGSATPTTPTAELFFRLNPRLRQYNIRGRHAA